MTLEDDIFGPDPDHDERGPRISVAPRSLPGCRDLTLALAGFLTFALVDTVMMWAPLTRRGASAGSAQAVTLLALAFGLGGMLVWSVRGALRPYGFGMMAAWGFLTLLSFGYLTGLAP